MFVRILKRAAEEMRLPAFVVARSLCLQIRTEIVSPRELKFAAHSEMRPIEIGQRPEL